MELSKSAVWKFAGALCIGWVMVAGHSSCSHWMICIAPSWVLWTMHSLKPLLLLQNPTLCAILHLSQNLTCTVLRSYCLLGRCLDRLCIAKWLGKKKKSNNKKRQSSYLKNITLPATYLSLSLLQGNVPTRESIHMYYQNHMMKLSRESGLDSIDKNPGQASGLQASERMDSLDSAASRDSISRYSSNFILWRIERLYSRHNFRQCLDIHELSNQRWAVLLIYPCYFDNEGSAIYSYSFTVVHSIASRWYNSFSTAWLYHCFLWILYSPLLQN